MKEWLSVNETIAEGLQGLPRTQQGLDALIDRNNWADHPLYARIRSARGGGMEYNFRVWPPVAQIQYAQKHLKVEFEADSDIDAPEHLTNRGAKERDARLAIVVAFESFSTGLELGQNSCRKIFCDKYLIGSISIDPWVKAIIPSFSIRSLARWIAVKKTGQINDLAVDRSQSRKRTGLLETANGGKIKTFVLALIAYQPNMQAELIRTQCQARFGDEVVAANGTVKPMPPVRTFQHNVKQWKIDEIVVLTKLSNPDKYRSTLAPSGTGSLRHITKPNALWQIDASPLDAMDTSKSRPTIYACIDIATRRTIIYVSKTPRASAVAMMLRKAIIAWGVPDAIKTDNGSDFVAEATKRLLTALNVEMQLSPAYTPQAKGHVERVIGTFQRGFARQLPGFVGHDVTDRKQIEDRQTFAKRLGADTADVFGIKFNMAEIQERADRWIESHYQHAKHSALNGLSPFEAARNSKAVTRSIDPRALDVLLMPLAGKNGYRKVTKFGVQINKFFYQTFVALPQDRVFVRMEPTDLGACYIFNADDGSFIEIAICPELAGIDPVEYQRIAKKARAEIMSERGRELSAQVRELTNGPAMIDLYLQVKSREAAAIAHNVLELPKPQIEHKTPELDAALHAATGIETASEKVEVLDYSNVEQKVVPLVPKANAPGARPRFKSDLEMVTWLLANPAKLNEHDTKFLNGKLSNWTFNELLKGAEIDIEDVKNLINPKVQEAK